jgi:hypothetical protein
MKSFFALVIVAAIAVAAYFFYFHQSALQSVVPLHFTSSASAPGAAALQTPPPVPAVPEKHIAPKGPYYLLQAVSITTDSGITGISIGTKVTVVNDKAKTWRVTDGQNKFDVEPSHLTNDLDVAAAVIQKDADAQAALQAGVHSQQEQQAAAGKARERGAAWLAQQLEIQRKQNQQSGVSPSPGEADDSSSGTSGGDSGPASPFGRRHP